MRTAHVFVFKDGTVKVISDPALAIVRKQEYYKDWMAGGNSFKMHEVPYEDDKLRPSQCQVFGPSGQQMYKLDERGR